MDKIQMVLDCARLARYIDQGDYNAFGELVSAFTGCNDAEWYVDNVANIAYIVSETLEYAGARLCIRGSGREIYIDTYSKCVTAGTHGVGYTQDKLSINSYCRERYEETR